LKAQLGPVVSRAHGQLLSYAQVRQRLNLSPTPLRQLPLAVPAQVRLLDVDHEATKDAIAQRRSERRAGL
jgi:hypothetical protein